MARRPIAPRVMGYPALADRRWRGRCRAALERVRRGPITWVDLIAWAAPLGIYEDEVRQIVA